jgi:hypothetical protein
MHTFVDHSALNGPIRENFENQEESITQFMEKILDDIVEKIFEKAEEEKKIIEEKKARKVDENEDKSLLSDKIIVEKKSIFERNAIKKIETKPNTSIITEKFKRVINLNI